jgi:uncharacterized protein
MFCWPDRPCLHCFKFADSLPKTILLLADGAEGQKFLGEKTEAIRAMSLVEGKPAAYVCESVTCKAPVTDPRALGELLKL